ncbi:MAG TPA: hypothetical protein VIC55_12820, partial [Gemmatimonadaceae bacterium]
MPEHPAAPTSAPGSSPAPASATSSITPPPAAPGPRSTAWRSSDVLRVSAIVFGLYFVLQLLWFASALVFVAFLGVLFGLAISAGVDRLTRVRVP